MSSLESIERAGRLMCRARRILAYGNLDSILQRPLYHGEGAVFPQFVERARGCELVDTTGQTFVDWVNGGGPVLLGYAHPAVEEAIRAQLACGPTVSMMHPLEVELAEELIEMVPCAEMVAFGKNGSDSLTGAVRAARALTGREVILQYGMHGFHDWYVVGNPQVRGAPGSLAPLIQPFPYNDLDALRELLERHAGRVAAVVMEPVREILPDPGYAQGVRELTRRHGALLIFDEVVTAFRLGNGGGQAFLGVEPDLACLGKSMANGMPISALVGRREFMEIVPAVAFGMTFRGETLTHAAARAVLRVLREEPVAEHVARIGERVRAATHRICARLGLRCRLGGPPARMTFVFEDQGGRRWDQLQALFVQECLKNGIFTNGNVLPSYAHDDLAVERTARGFERALEVVAAALEPDPSAPRAMIAIGFLEHVGEEARMLHLSGWMLLPDRAPDAVQVRLADGSLVPALTVERPDVAAAHPDVPGARQAGFALNVPLPALACDGRRELTLRALCGERVAFLCRVVLEGQAWTRPQWIGDGVIYA